MFKSKLPEMLARKIGQEGRIITQKELAKIANVREATVSTWMSDKPMSHVKAETVESFARALGCEIWDLIELIPTDSEDQKQSLLSQPAVA